MANADNPIGLRPIRKLGGQVYSGSGSLYHVASGDSQVIASGDPVILTGTADTNGIPTVTRASAGAANRITGVMNAITNGEGTVLQDSTLNTAASTSQYILVHDDPMIVFEAQMSSAFAVTDIGNNANLLAAASPADGKSGWEVNSTGIAGTATLQVKIIRLVRRQDNEVGANANVEVLINLPTWANDTVGV